MGPHNHCPVPLSLTSEQGEVYKEENTSIYSYKTDEVMDGSLVKYRDFNLFAPSRNHLESSKNIIKRLNDSPQVFTFKELLNQQYDIETGNIVFNFRNLNSGDPVIVKDTIRSITYDSNLDISDVWFDAD